SSTWSWPSWPVSSFRASSAKKSPATTASASPGSSAAPASIPAWCSSFHRRHPAQPENTTHPLAAYRARRTATECRGGACIVPSLAAVEMREEMNASPTYREQLASGLEPDELAQVGTGLHRVGERVRLEGVLLGLDDEPAFEAGVG